MRTYENKEELKNEINKSFAKYISEFDDIPEYLKDMRVDEVDRTPAENLAYQVGWTTLVIKWESDERKGSFGGRDGANQKTINVRADGTMDYTNNEIGRASCRERV